MANEQLEILRTKAWLLGEMSRIKKLDFDTLAIICLCGINGGIEACLAQGRGEIDSQSVWDFLKNHLHRSFCSNEIIREDGTDGKQ
ncbi:MAG: hypothetical protein AB7F40_11400 [Victivallaceae bacterium]